MKTAFIDALMLSWVKGLDLLENKEAHFEAKPLNSILIRCKLVKQLSADA